MRKIRSSNIFDKWLSKLRDTQARQKIIARVKRLSIGNPGDHRFLGDICELRIDHGPGYRVYYKDSGKEIVILLSGGDKSTQQADIAKAREIATSYEEK